MVTGNLVTAQQSMISSARLAVTLKSVLPTLPVRLDKPNVPITPWLMVHVQCCLVQISNPIVVGHVPCTIMFSSPIAFHMTIMPHQHLSCAQDIGPISVSFVCLAAMPTPTPPPRLSLQLLPKILVLIFLISALSLCPVDICHAAALPLVMPPSC